MGFMMGGIIIKDAASLSDEDILGILDRRDHHYSGSVTMEEATSGEFEGIAFGRTDSLVMVLGRHIPYSCSFDENDPSEIDDNLEQTSEGREVLCFLINSVTDTYAWSVFINGKRVRGKSIAEKNVLSEFGKPLEYDDKIEMNDDGMITLIENFTGYSYIDLVFEKRIRAEAYIE